MAAAVCGGELWEVKRGRKGRWRALLLRAHAIGLGWAGRVRVGGVPLGVVLQRGEGAPFFQPRSASRYLSTTAKQLRI